MVSRRLNKPIGRVQHHTVFWLSQVLKSTWTCRLCLKEQPQGSVSFEVTVKHTQMKNVFDEVTKVVKAEQSVQPIKLHLCLACASQFLDDVKLKVDLCLSKGPDGYRLIEEM